MARILKHARPISQTPPPLVGSVRRPPGSQALLELPFASGIDSAKREVKAVVEGAVRACGSAAELARRLGVKPPTVSQWRAGHNLPDVVHFIQIQRLAKQGVESSRLNSGPANFAFGPSTELHQSKRRNAP